MPITLPALPYELDALEPYISKETLEYHYGKHHKAYVDNLNKLIQNTEYDNKNLEEIIQTSSGSIFNNAAQVFNHNFYWNCLASNKQKNNPTEITSNHNTKNIFLLSIEKTFGGLEEFKNKFSQAAFGIFGSGWAWLIKRKDQDFYNIKLEIITTSNAQTPLTSNLQPLLTCDVWEHAYYIDYRNARAKYIEAFWEIVNWNFVEKNFHANDK